MKILFSLFLLASFSSYTSANCDSGFIYSDGGVNTIDFTAVNATAVSYDWDFGDGTYSNVNTLSHTYLGTGSYTVCLTVEVYIQGILTSCTSCETVIVSDSTVNVEGLNENVEISIYPNPFKELFYVNLGEIKDEVTIQLLDSTGKTILTKKTNTSSLIQTREFQLNKGLYFLVVLVGDEKRKTFKLIKE